MISNQALQQGFDQLQTYFVSLFQSNKFLSELKTNSQTKQIFEKSLSIFSYVCNNLDKSQTANELINQYRQLGINPQFKESSDLQFEDDYDLIDQIKYLDIYCKNTYGASVADLGKETTNKPPVLEPVNDHAQEIKQNHADQAQAAFFNFTSEPQSNTKGPYFDRASFADQASKLRLHHEIQTGSFYCFETKPREILYIRYGLLIIYIVITALFAILAIMLYFQASQYNYSKDDLVKIFPIYKNLIENTKIQNFQGIFLTTPYQPSFVFMIMGVFGLYFSSKNYKSLFKTKNDNQIYRLELRGLFWLTFIILYFITQWRLSTPARFFSPFSIVELSKTASDFMLQNYNNNAHSWIKSQHPNDPYFYQALFIMCVTILFFLGTIFSLFIAGIFLNPKRDIEKINITLANYREEFFNSKF